jgi:hypothetical protein
MQLTGEKDNLRRVEIISIKSWEIGIHISLSSSLDPHTRTTPLLHKIPLETRAVSLFNLKNNK